MSTKLIVRCTEPCTCVWCTMHRNEHIGDEALCSTGLEKYDNKLIGAAQFKFCVSIPARNDRRSGYTLEY